MATELEQFTVYAPPKMVKQLKMLAEGDGRTLSNFVVRALVGCMGGELTAGGGYNLIPKPDATMRGRQVDISEAIADAVKRGPSKPRSRA